MLTLIDNITIVLCVVGIFAISVFMSKKNTDMEAYYHANKALPWSLAVGTIAASWYGGNGTIGTVGYVTTMAFPHSLSGPSARTLCVSRWLCGLLPAFPSRSTPR